MAMFLGTFHVSAQEDPEPMDTWPYLYQNFMSGAVRTSTGVLLEYSSFNICVVDGSLHYIKDGVIMKADMSKVFTALVGEDDVYINTLGRMSKIILETEDGAVVKNYAVDFEKLKKVEIGYGVTSSTASSRNTSLSLLGMETISGVNMVDMSLNRAEQQKGSGKYIPLKTEVSLLVNGRLIPANKKSIQDICGKTQTQEFLKKNKVKWSKAETLAPVLGFVKEHIAK